MLVADGAYVYGVAATNIWRMAKATGELVTITTTVAEATALAVSGDRAAFIMNGNVFVTSAQAGSSPALVAQGDTATGLAIDGDWLYWAGSDQNDSTFPGLVRRVHLPLDGTANEPLFFKAASSIHGFAVFGGAVYWSDWSAGGLMRMALTGKAPTRIAAIETPTGLRFDGGKAYVLAQSVVDPTVMQVDLAGLAAQEVGRLWVVSSRGTESAQPVVVRGGQVYWVNDGTFQFGALTRSPLGPRDATTLPPVFEVSDGRNLGGLTADDSDLYFTDCASGSLQRTPL